MKKIFAAILAAAMALSITACSGGSGTSASASSAPANVASDGSYQFTDTVTIVVPFNAGSNTDSQVRFIQPYLEKHLGVSTIVVNSGGASGTIGTTDFLTQKADGNTILFSLPTPTVYKPVSGGTQYAVEDLIPVSQVSSSPFYLAVSASNDNFPDAQAALDYIKANPGKFTYANAGNGGIAHLAFASFVHGEGMDALSVPFTGGTADCYTAVMGNHVMAHAVSEPDLVGRSDYRVLMNLGSKSTTEGFEDIPTLSELGYEGYVTDTFAGFYYMKGVDSAIVEAFDAAVQATLADEEFLAAAAASNFGHCYADAETFAASISDTVEVIKPVLDSLG